MLIFCQRFRIQCSDHLQGKWGRIECGLIYIYIYVCVCVCVFLVVVFDGRVCTVVLSNENGPLIGNSMAGIGRGLI
jgi:hypothetical protein